VSVILKQQDNIAKVKKVKFALEQAMKSLTSALDAVCGQ
jgi:hypothetical protein